MDWDELEEQAARDDKERGSLSEGEDEGYNKKRKGGGKAPVGGGGKRAKR